jgi:outer membrane immunogenic protein
MLYSAVACTAVVAASTAASAADLPRQAPMMKAPPPVWNWTGFYAGIYAGGGTSESNAALGPSFRSSADINGIGFLGGVQAGYNWQLNPNWVAGFEADIGYLGINRSYMNWNDPTVLAVKAGGYGTARLRFGYAAGPSLIYASGGAAFLDVRNSASANVPALGFVGSFSHSGIESGWTAGVGIETAIAPHWSARAEYLYIDVGQSTFPFFDTTTIFENRFHVFRLGLNYLFNQPSAQAPTHRHSWTGFYVGLNGGIGVSQSRATAPTLNPGLFPGETRDLNGSGFTGGAQVGYNVQLNPNWVAGIEADINHLGLDRFLRDWNTPDYASGAETRGFATIRARFAYSAGPALLYVTGGAALARVENIQAAFPPTGMVATSVSKTASGWTAGGGIETMLSANWTAKLEYLYVDVGSGTVVGPTEPGFSVVTSSITDRFQIGRFGLNYRFDGPVVAKY